VRPGSASTRPNDEDSVRAKERVLGIGGFFFRSRDPRALAQWYSTHLGVRLTPQDYDSPSWRQAEGPTVFEPFPQDAALFGRPEQQWMINFRVRDLAAMVRQLRDANLVVEVDTQLYPNGVFALTHDPEGNPIQLWEPRGAAANAGN
jgi:glyoxylase I family protein